MRTKDLTPEQVEEVSRQVERGLPVKDIAASLNMSVNTFMVKIASAGKRIDRRLVDINGHRKEDEQ